VAGAEATLSQALTHQVELVVLKANSPSCGAHQHYDGHFCGKLRVGQGVTAALLEQNGFQVINEEDLEYFLQHKDRAAHLEQTGLMQSDT
jgi:uncharacterized protein YbbK (DUF523 family)